MYTIREAKKDIMDGIRGYLLKDENGVYLMAEENRLPFYLEGAPGIGKTQIVRQVADELGIGFVDFSLVHNTRNNILGLPVIETLSDGTKYTNFTMSEIIAKVQQQELAGKSEGILLLDEFPCMSDTITPIMLSFLQTKNIGCHRLPRGWVIVLCGNPKEYNRSARTFDAAVTDRLRKMKITVSWQDFLEYGNERKMHPAVLSFLRDNKGCLYKCEMEKGGQELELVTCRSWDNLSCQIIAYESLQQQVTEEFVKQFIKSDKIAKLFLQYYRKWSHGFTQQKMRSICEGTADSTCKEEFALLSYGEKWSLLDMILKNLKADFDGKRMTQKQKRLIAEKVEHLFAFTSGDEEEELLWEQLYVTINKDSFFLNALAENKSEAYVRMCRKKYLAG